MDTQAQEDSVPAFNSREHTSEILSPASASKFFRNLSKLFVDSDLHYTLFVHNMAPNARDNCSRGSVYRRRSPGRGRRPTSANTGDGPRNPAANKVPRLDCTPKITLPPNENSAYEMVKLKNGLNVLLISTRMNKDPAWSLVYDDMTRSGSQFSELGPSYMASVPSDIYCGGPDPSEDRQGCMCLPGFPPKTKCIGTIMVGSGSLQDPDNFQGLAHFCEHVIHHGSEKYPNEEEFRQFISKYDGYSNAFTDKTVTNYHFQIDSSQESLKEALNRYGDMMQAPRFPLESLVREVESVDNEYYLRRIYHFFQRTQLLNSVAIPGKHPMNQFMIGSSKSLLSDGKVVSHEKKLKEAVHAFHKAHYYAENMKLVVRSPEPLEFMCKCVEESFGQISQKSQSSMTPTTRVPKGIPYDKVCFNRLYTVKPRHGDGHELYLTWALPADAWKDYKCKPLEYIGAVLADDSDGGLSYYLRSMGWSLEMMAGCSCSGTHRNEFVSLFELIVTLTQDGRARIHEVIESIFGFIKYHQVEGAKLEVWEELRQIEQVKFKAFKMGSSVNCMTNMSRWMHLFEDKELISGGHFFFEFNGEKINEYLKQLTPANANYMLFTLDTGKTEYKTEDLYQTEYLVQDLGEWLQTFERVKPHKDCHMKGWAASCPVVPRFRIEDICSITEIIGMSDKMVVQYSPIQGMSSPQAMFFLRIKSRMDVRTLITKKCLLDVWEKMLLLMIVAIPNMNKQVEFAKFGMQAVDSDFLFQFVGLNNNMADTFISMLDRFDNFEEEATVQSFQMAKESVLRCQYRTLVETKSLAVHFLRRLLFKDAPSCYDSHDLLLNTSFNELLTFIREFKESMFFTCSVNGVIHKEDAVRVAMTLERIRTQPMGFLRYEAEVPCTSRKLLSHGERCLRVRSLQPKERMTTVLNFYELGPQCDDSVKVVHLITALLSPKLFHELRTIEQLGYDVGCQLFIDPTCTGMLIYVVTHADKHSPCYVDERIDNFLQKFYNDDLKPESISTNLTKRQIYRDPEYVKLYFSKYFLKGGLDSGFKKLSVQVVGCQEGEDKAFCMCEKSKVPTTGCKLTSWLPPLGTIGKAKTPVRLGGRNGGFEGDGGSGNGGGPFVNYFIQDIEKYLEGE